MITLTSADRVNASPERVWRFLTNLHEGDTYLHWHPVDHRTFQLLRGSGQTIGSTFNAVEMLGGKKSSLDYRLNRAEPQKHLEYVASGLLRPLGLATGSFTLKASGKNQTQLVAKVHIGYKLPILEAVRAFVNLAAIQKHMEEEGHYLNQVSSK